MHRSDRTFSRVSSATPELVPTPRLAEGERSDTELVALLRAGGAELRLSASIGIALYPFHGSDVPGLFSTVDIAMYQAKELGRNRSVLFVAEKQAALEVVKKRLDAIGLLQAPGRIEPGSRIGGIPGVK